MSISDRIKFLYNQYEKLKVAPSNKQSQLIEKLGGDVTNSTTTTEAQKQIRFLIGSQKITLKQQNLVRSLPKDEINKVLKRDVIIEELTRFELQRIMNTLYNRHALGAKVYNHPIISTGNYEYGWQESSKCPDGKLYYIVFYDLLMIDLDTNIDVSMIQSLLLERLSQLKLTGRLYKTYNGYHLFITSKSLNHKSNETKYVMGVLGCDIFYNTFSYLNGFKVRLNPKLRDNEIVAAEYIGVIGEEPEDNNLLQLLGMHDEYIREHKRQ